MKNIFHHHTSQSQLIFFGMLEWEPCGGGGERTSGWKREIALQNFLQSCLIEKRWKAQSFALLRDAEKIVETVREWELNDVQRLNAINCLCWFKFFGRVLAALRILWLYFSQINKSWAMKFICCCGRRKCYGGAYEELCSSRIALNN